MKIIKTLLLLGALLIASTAEAQTSVMDARGAVSAGYTPGKLIATGTSTDSTTIKASPGVVGYITASNIAASVNYLKFYNKTTCASTDTPVHTFAIPGATTGGGSNIPIPTQGIKFTAGICFRITTGSADNDNTGVTAGDVIVNYGYK